MKKDVRYVINDSKVLSENLDGETIIINFERGDYYSLNKSGSVLWSLIESKQNYNKIFDYFDSHFTAEPGVIVKSIEYNITFLKNDGLILEQEGTSTSESSDAALESKELFEPISIIRFEDMQEMILADPIHDVDEIGWPQIKPELKK
jgi:hypothetical protein